MAGLFSWQRKPSASDPTRDRADTTAAAEISNLDDPPVIVENPDSDLDSERVNAGTSPDTSPPKTHAAFRVPKEHMPSTLKMPKPTVRDIEFLTPYMPALFGLDLPPCNTIIQVAYEIVVTKLRDCWLLYRGQESVAFAVKTIRQHLQAQNRRWPPGFLEDRKFKRRKPWCREEVFKYQLRWIRYFEHEVEMLESVEKSTLEAVQAQEQSPFVFVPQELGFDANKINNEIEGWWFAWRQKKRAFTAPPPDMFVDWEDCGDATKASDNATEAATSGDEDEDRDEGELEESQSEESDTDGFLGTESVPPNFGSKKDRIMLSIFGCK